MKEIILLSALFIFKLSFSQIGFEEKIINNAKFGVNNPTAVVSADIDNDGDLDILVSSESDNKISWYENLDGLGNFGNQRIISTIADEAKDVTVSDLDGDGDLDVLSGDHDNISWYENLDGLGSFGEQQIIAEPNGASAVYTGDIDNDGDQDIVSLSSNFTRELTWYENLNGEGDFEEKQIIDNGTHFTDVVLSDIDNDGDLDLVSVAGWNQQATFLAWYENLDGLGNFGGRQYINYQDIPYGYNAIHIVDIDNDGDDDIFTTLSSGLTDKISWFENLGDGNFATEQIISNLNNPTSIYSGDLDNDGDLDIVYSSYTEDSVIWHENLDGQGNFGNQQLISNLANGAVSVCTGDFNGDSYIDIVSSSKRGNEITWYDNIDGQGNFNNQQIISFNYADLISSIVSSDIDNDGFVDLITSSSGDDKISWYQNLDGQGNFNYNKINVLNIDVPTSVYAEDIDGDNDIDIIFGSRNNDIIGWLENLDGLGNFSTEHVITNNGAGTVIAKDIDQDGDIDIVAAYEYTDKIVWFENLDGLGNFGSENIISSSFQAIKSIFVVDFDGDSKLDILSGSFADDKIVWIKNEGNGNFGSQQSINTINGPISVFACDIDNDGDQDAISVSKWDDLIVWYENDGVGNFNEPITIATDVNSFGKYSVYCSDIDNDGDFDIISSSEYTNQVSWIENLDGQGHFGMPQTITINLNNNRIVHSDDLNNDGKMDIISASSWDNEFVWYKNKGVVNEINGEIKLDINFDGCDDTDSPLSNIMIVANNGVESLATFSNNGYYRLFPDIGDYTVNASPYLPDYYNFNPISQNISFSDIGNVSNIDFCLEAISTGFRDLNIEIYPLDTPRPGFDVSYQLVYSNFGLTVLSGDITLEYDNSKLIFLGASEIVNSQSSNELTFNYSNIGLFETRIIELNFNILAPPTVNIGDNLSFTANINPIIGDQTENNNTFNLNQTTIGSYDPNDITVLEGDQILIDDVDKFLHYLIRFQNTGTASAVNIKINNIIDDDLDWTTLQLVNLSHDNYVEIINENEIIFNFNNIYLPDSTTDEPNSHGFIAYKIKPKANIVLGDVITNKANIFFDFNEAIETNIATTTIVNVLATSENVLLDFSVYPIPTENSLNINSKSEISMIEIYNKLGQLIMKNTRENIIDISNLPHGLYFVKVKDINGNSGIKKMIKK